MADTNPNTRATGSFNSIMIADRRLLILRLLENAGPLGIHPLCAAVAEFGHTSDAMTIMGDLAALEQISKVKLTEDRMMVEVATPTTCANAQPLVPMLTEINEREHDPGHERDQDKGKGRETA